MARIFTQIASRSFASLLCILSLWSTPAKVEASCCEDECCDSGWWSGGNGRTALIIGGAAVVGGIAGAIAGNASSGHGHHGKRGPAGPEGSTGATGAVGPTGPAGSSGFVTDTGQSLTFSFNLSGVDLIEEDMVAIPFVTRPDGITVEGPPVTFDTLPLTIPSLSIVGPVFGTYHAGIQFSPIGIDVEAINLTITVAASRDGSTTNLGTQSIAQPNVFDSAFGGTGGQAGSDFTYDPYNIPFPYAIP